MCLQFSLGFTAPLGGTIKYNASINILESEDEEQEIVEEAPIERFELEFSLKAYLQKLVTVCVLY